MKGNESMRVAVLMLRVSMGTRNEVSARLYLECQVAIAKASKARVR